MLREWIVSQAKVLQSHYSSWSIYTTTKPRIVDAHVETPPFCIVLLQYSSPQNRIYNILYKYIYYIYITPKQWWFVMMFHPDLAVLGTASCILRRTHCILEPGAPRHVHSMPPSAQQFGPICHSSRALRIVALGKGWTYKNSRQQIKTLSL
jgi:hypothetical protein